MLDVCSLLPDKSIDLIIADPPYNLTKSFNGTTFAKKKAAVESEIAIAAFIDNVNLRGRIIEYLITAEDDLKATLMYCLRNGQPLPEIFAADELGDYEREFDRCLIL